MTLFGYPYGEYLPLPLLTWPNLIKISEIASTLTRLSVVRPFSGMSLEQISHPKISFSKWPPVDPSSWFHSSSSKIMFSRVPPHRTSMMYIPGKISFAFRSRTHFPGEFLNDISPPSNKPSKTAVSCYFTEWESFMTCARLSCCSMGIRGKYTCV